MTPSRTGSRGAPPRRWAPRYYSGYAGGCEVAGGSHRELRTRRRVASVPVGSLIGLALCVVGIARPDRPAGRAEPPRVDLRPARQHRGRRRAAQRPGRPVPRQAPAGGDRAARRRRRHLAPVHRRERARRALLQPKWSRPRSCRWVFVGPALVLLGGLPRLPGGRHRSSAASRTTTAPVHARQLRRASTDPEFLEILRNNVLWLIVGTAGSVGLGLLIAGLFDRVRRESLAKIFIFLPLAISLVGASVIWTLRLRLAARRASRSTGS